MQRSSEADGTRDSTRVGGSRAYPGVVFVKLKSPGSPLKKIFVTPDFGFVLLATTKEGAMVGAAFASAFLGLEHGGRSGWLEELYVLPAWRGKGIGSALVEASIQMAQHRGWRALDLEVDFEHMRAAKLYARYGFRPCSRVRFGRKLSVVMNRTLNSSNH